MELKLWKFIVSQGFGERFVAVLWWGCETQSVARWCRVERGKKDAKNLSSWLDQRDRNISLHSAVFLIKSPFMSNKNNIVKWEFYWLQNDLLCVGCARFVGVKSSNNQFLTLRPSFASVERTLCTQNSRKQQYNNLFDSLSTRPNMNLLFAIWDEMDIGHNTQPVRVFKMKIYINFPSLGWVERESLVWFGPDIAQQQPLCVDSQHDEKIFN